MKKRKKEKAGVVIVSLNATAPSPVDAAVPRHAARPKRRPRSKYVRVFFVFFIRVGMFLYTEKDCRSPLSLLCFGPGDGNRRRRITAMAPPASQPSDLKQMAPDSTELQLDFYICRDFYGWGCVLMWYQKLRLTCVKKHPLECVSN